MCLWGPREWLAAFRPSQFVLVPMRAAFRDAASRAETPSQLARRLGATLDAAPVRAGCVALKRKHRAYPPLASELTAHAVAEMQRVYFAPDLLQLAALLAPPLAQHGAPAPGTVHVVGYRADAHNATQLAAYLTASW